MSQRFFEQAKVQMEEFKRSETRLLEENQQLKIAMKDVDAKLAQANKEIQDQISDAGVSEDVPGHVVSPIPLRSRDSLGQSTGRSSFLDA